MRACKECVGVGGVEWEMTSSIQAWPAKSHCIQAGQPARCQWTPPSPLGDLTRGGALQPQNAGAGRHKVAGVVVSVEPNQIRLEHCGQGMARQGGAGTAEKVGRGGWIAREGAGEASGRPAYPSALRCAEL